ncbi:hypothetical protein [Actinoallomurus sp. NPDC052274]|uniref:WXG100 family type VII secretion target n=1 Tax=Actinoallomurus sp. NPDC052274 TaxID=3155420 RepID=UPI0034251B27
MAISPSQAAEVAYILTSPTHTDYDHAEETYVSPSGLHDTAQQLHDLANAVADYVGRISDTLKSLNLNWQGETQKEADDFSSRWTAVMGEVFGSEDRPEDGVLNAMAQGIATAVNNYNKAEFGIISAWSKFAGSLPTDGQGGSSKPSDDIPPDVMDTNKTAITADYPNN